jgi:hypothetical protein
MSMNSKIAFDERVTFADRLISALERAGVSTNPSEFTRQFNLRADGAAVTVHGTRKWLRGEAIPTQERIQVLATWLGVHSAWLRFGDPENGHYAVPGAPTTDPSSADLILLRDVKSLSPAAQGIIREIVDAFMRQNRDVMASVPDITSKKRD